jgi:PAS domain S-box-containing protein
MKTTSNKKLNEMEGGIGARTASLEKHLLFEQLLANLSAQFIDLELGAVDRKVESGFTQILEFFGLDRCGLFKADPKARTACLTHIALREGIGSVPHGVNLVPHFPWIADGVFSGEIVSVSAEDFPPEALVDRRSAEGLIPFRYGLFIPLTVFGEVRYMIGLTVNRSESIPGDDIVPRLRLLGEIIVGALERVQASRLLSESEEKYRTVVERANEAIFVSQAETAIFCNKQAVEMSGFSQEEIFSKPFIEFIHPEDRDKVREEYLARLSGARTAARYTIRIRTKAGQVKWVIVNSAQIEWEGRPAALTMLTDITHRKAMEDELLDRSIKLVEFQAVAHVGFLDWDLVTDQIVLSEEACRMFGVNPSEPIKTHELITQIVHPDDRALVRHDLDLALSGKKPYDLDHRVLRPDGAVVWVHSHVELRRNATGEPTTFLGTVVDITDRKNAELTLLQTSCSLAEAQRIAQMGSWDWNILTNELIWSDEVYRIFGLTRQSFGATYEAFLEVIHPDDRAELEEAIRKVLASDSKPYNIVHRIRRPVGGERIVRERGEVTRREGKPVRMIGTVQDLTEMKRAQREADAQREALARMDRATSMGQLTGSIAHELNQPLTGILSTAQAAELMVKQDQCTWAEMSEIIEEIVADAKRASDIIRNLRELYREQKGDFTLVAVNEVVDEALQVLSSEFVMQQVALSVDCSEHLPRVKGNKVQLQQVLVNLIMNGHQAMHDMAEGDRRIHIATAPGPEGIVVSVEDSGPGIDPEHIESIFEPLATWKPGGTGMGLAISDVIIVAHRGRMWAENKPEGGARISFVVPPAKEGA